MYRNAATAALGAIALAGCMQATPEGWAPPANPTMTMRINGQYDVFGACAYQRLSSESIGMRIEDLRGANTIKIYHQYTSTSIVFSIEVRQYDITIRQIQAGSFEVVIRAPANIAGPDQAARSLWSKIESCPVAQPAAAMPAPPSTSRR